jgi:GNAT superfamily N-acetyltransferase
MQKIFSELWTKYETAVLLEGDEQKIAFQQILADLENVSDGQQNDEFFYLKGFILYMKEPSDVSQAKTYFQKSLEINPVESYARLYLGHCLYDSGDYKEAEYQFSIVDNDGFNADVREFFQMIVEEMLVCCHIKEKGSNEQTLSEAKKIINKYAKSNYLDDYLFNLSKVLAESDLDLDKLAVKDLIFRQATIEDLPEIVRMLADDFLGATREKYENPLPESYIKAFKEIEADKNNELIVAEMNGDIVGTLQITFTPSIAFQGGKRATVESVRVDDKFRGQGIGREMMLWAIERARKENCIVLQLTTNSKRIDAHRFYEQLGFKGSHIGMKLSLK